MMEKAFDPALLDELAATVGLSIKETNKAGVSTLLASTRANVMRRANALPIESAPALLFDPR
jgi:hypothetical protein